MRKTVAALKEAASQKMTPAKGYIVNVVAPVPKTVSDVESGIGLTKSFQSMTGAAG